MPDPVQVLIELALQEDIGRGDITSDALFDGEEIKKTGVLLAKEECVVSGLEIARRVFDTVDHHLAWKAHEQDGARVSKGTEIATVSGRFKSLLRAERTALNFLQHLSGVATLTANFVEAVRGTNAKILDTRKTLPGFRMLEKKAVRDGGGKNHRIGLYDRYLIKDNHLMGASIAEALNRAKNHRTQKDLEALIEIEVTRLDQVEEAVAGGADIVLMDNFSVENLAKAVKQVAGRVKIEASGGIRRENVLSYAETGVDFISVGTITHSAKAADISLEIS